MDVSTFLTTTRATLVGWRTFAGTGIGPPAESGKMPVTCCVSVEPDVSLPIGGREEVLAAGGRIVKSSVEAWLWLAANATSIRQPATTASPASIHPHLIGESMFGAGFFAWRFLCIGFCMAPSLLSTQSAWLRQAQPLLYTHDGTRRSIVVAVLASAMLAHHASYAHP